MLCVGQLAQLAGVLPGSISQVVPRGSVVLLTVFGGEGSVRKVSTTTWCDSAMLILDLVTDSPLLMWRWGFARVPKGPGTGQRGVR